MIPTTASNKKKQCGFTIIEVLVVLIIVAMTTLLLSSGLSIAMSSMEKLKTRHLESRAIATLALFRESIQTAVLYHPEKPTFSGDSYTINLVSKKPIDTHPQYPIKVSWRIREDVDGKVWLWYSNLENNSTFKLMPLDGNTRFYYQSENAMHPEFLPESAELPEVISLRSGDAVLIAVSPLIPKTAIVPPEYAVFGKYEF